MDVETALKSIEEWYDGGNFQIGPIVTEPKGEKDEFPQSDVFLSVIGWQEQIGTEGDTFRGVIYFEFKPGKFISTSYWC